jgi:heptosyltransferase I
MKPTLPQISPRKILVTQLGSLRDSLQTIPLSVDLKAQWPNAELHWIVECGLSALLEAHPCIDQVTTIERGWLRRPQGWQHLKSSLAERQYDLVIDSQGLSKSALIGWLAGAGTRIGFAKPNARELAPWLATHRVKATCRHRVDAVRELLSPWQEVQPGGGRYNMPRYAAAQESIENFVNFHGLQDSDSWFAIHPGAIWPTARWPVERFGSVVAELYRKYRLRAVILWMSEHERLLSQVIAENSPGAAVAAPALDLPELAELIRRARFLLSADSEPLHIASAVGTTCLSLHGPTWADESGAYGEGHIAVQSPLPHLPRRLLRRGPNTTMQAIDCDEVIYHADRLLNRQAKPRKQAA